MKIGLHTLLPTYTQTDLTYAQREVSFVPDIEVEQQMCVKLLQQRLVLLVRHLLDQKLHSDQHADVHVTCWQLNTFRNNRLSFTTVYSIICIFIGKIIKDRQWGDYS